MRMTWALYLGGIFLCGQGCSPLWQAARTSIVQPLCFFPGYNEAVDCAHDRAVALQAWLAYKNEFAGTEFSDSFACGFKAGYADFLFRGGNGNPPPLPPRCYWNSKFETPEGHQAIKDWFAGFREGAAQAQVSGNRELVTVPSSLSADGFPPPDGPDGSPPHGPAPALPGGTPLPVVPAVPPIPAETLPAPRPLPPANEIRPGAPAPPPAPAAPVPGGAPANPGPGPVLPMGVAPRGCRSPVLCSTWRDVGAGRDGARTPLSPAVLAPPAPKAAKAVPLPPPAKEAENPREVADADDSLQLGPPQKAELSASSAGREEEATGRRE